jgi:uncharacterized protein (DUF952 family)/uncharacterized protein YqgV (UPF0045/DUF77 family)
MIYHITTKSLWQKAVETGKYSCESLLTEGFIHCSYPHQIHGVLDRYYQNVSDLLLLHVDETKSNYNLKVELAPSVQDVFPHIFEEIVVKDVVDIVPIDSSNNWRKNLFIHNASFQIIPMQTADVGYPVIDKLMELIHTKQMQSVTTAFNTSVQGTLQQITDLFQEINNYLTTNSLATDWICNMQLHASNVKHILESDKI